MSLEIDLEPSHPAALAALVDDLYNPALSTYEDWLAPGEFARRFAPQPAATAAVAGWLSSHGLRPIRTSAFAFTVTGPSSRIASALGVTFTRYRRSGGAAVYRADGAPLVPTSVTGVIAGLEGLSDGPVSSPQLSPEAQGVGGAAQASVDACGAAAQEASSVGAYTPDAAGAYYGVKSLQADGAEGNGQTVGLFELGPSSASDISTYEACFGLDNTVSVVQVDGGATPGVEATAEADLDAEQAATQAPGTAVISYEGPNTPTGVVDLWRQIVDSDVATVVSTSWGLCEAQMSQIGAIDPLLEQAATQGQAVFAGTGDSGSEDCDTPPEDSDEALAVDYPASSPWVTAVGGTSLSMNGSEVVWNRCAGVVASACDPGGSGGGGVSTSEPKPTWQSSLSTPSGFSCGANGTNCREVPDIAADAGVPQVFYANGQWGAFSGTSVATPMVAGLWAARQSACLHPAPGDASSVLYAAAAAGDYGTALNDITSGNNDFTGTNGGQFAAGVGYDLASGLGSPNGAGLACAEAVGVSPSQSPAGSDVTVNGLGLERATISFAGTPATVVASTATSATVVVPAGSGSVAVTASGALGNGTASATFTYGPAPADFTRIAGITAIGTAIAVSTARFPSSGSAPAVVLARSDFFSDALAGGPLAAHVDGPLLITPGASQSSAIDPGVLSEIERVLRPGGTVYMLGGPLALSPHIDPALENLGYAVVRIAGTDEYGTAVAIAQQLGNPGVVFEATGLNFPDALSAVPAAIREGGAILLTDGTSQAPETAAYLAAHPGDRRYAIGGPLAAAGADPTAIAIYGQDQYGTSAAVAANFFASPTVVGAATGASFSDALSGGPMLGLDGGPLLLVAPTGPLPATIAAYLQTVTNSVRSGILFGGPLAVSNGVLAELDAAL